MPIEYRRNPNGFNGNKPKRIVLHCMAERIDYADQRMDAPDFLRHVGLSSHAMVRSDGTLIHCREDNEGAYHAEGHNQDTLGIELLVPDAHNLAQLKDKVQHTWLTGHQYLAAAEWVRDKMKRHEIPRDEVVRHMDLDPERRWFDPGPAFPWSLFQAELTR